MSKMDCCFQSSWYSLHGLNFKFRKYSNKGLILKTCQYVYKDLRSQMSTFRTGEKKKKGKKGEGGVGETKNPPNQVVKSQVHSQIKRTFYTQLHFQLLFSNGKSFCDHYTNTKVESFVFRNKRVHLAHKC